MGRRQCTTWGAILIPCPVHLKHSGETTVKSRGVMQPYTYYIYIIIYIYIFGYVFWEHTMDVLRLGGRDMMGLYYESSWIIPSIGSGPRSSGANLISWCESQGQTLPCVFFGCVPHIYIYICIYIYIYKYLYIYIFIYKYLYIYSSFDGSQTWQFTTLLVYKRGLNCWENHL